MVCFKDYLAEDGAPADDGDAEAIRFGEHSFLVPTLVLEEDPKGEEGPAFGWEASQGAERRPGLLRKEFKVDLAFFESPEPEARQRAERAEGLTERFLGYLRK